MGYQAAKLLHRLLAREEMPLQRILVPPVRVIARRSTDYRSLTDPAVIQAMHFIRNHACKGIKVEQVLDAVGISRSNTEKRFKEEVGETIHALIHAEKLEKARSLLISTTLAINEISQMCGYPSLQYFYSVFKRSTSLRRRSIATSIVKRCCSLSSLQMPCKPDSVAPSGTQNYICAAIRRWLSGTSRTSSCYSATPGRVTLQLMNHRRGGDFLIRLTQLGARLAERRISRMRVQVGDIRAHRLLNRRELRVTFHLTRRIGTTPFRALHAEQVIVATRQFRGSPAAFRRRHRRHHAGWDNVDALQQRIPRNTTRVAGPAHFIALRDIFHTRAFRRRPAVLVLF